MLRLYLLFVPAAALALSQPVEFNRDVRPILSDRCFACHGPDAAQRKSKLRLDREQETMADLTPGDPAKSVIFKRITAANPAMRMPPAYAGRDKLSDPEIEIIRKWIEQGAKWQNHWSFIPPTRRAGTSIDSIVRARLDRDRLQPSPPADPRTLLRRVTLDLTGLPPSTGEVDAYLSNTAPDAYEKVVDRLLASPRYAERMAIRWLEAARYADTNGYQSDGPRDMWRWRDWVIDAFRNNMRFDQFTIEQLAGDLLPKATLSQKIATGFQRNHRTSAEGGIVDEEFRTEYVADRAETTSTVWLGLTMGCARCHDHKFDPIRQKDFYSLFAFYNNVPEKGFVYDFGNEEPYIKAPLPEQQSKLSELDRKIDTAEKRYYELWAAEKQPNVPAATDWTVKAGLVFHDPADHRFDGKVDGIASTDKNTARFNYRDPFTFAARIRPESPNGVIMSRAEDYFEGSGHALYLVEGRLRLHVIFRWTDLGLRVESAEPLNLSQWQHVLVTYDASMHAAGVHMYVDGVQVPIRILFDQCIWPINVSQPFRIGAGGGMKFKGLISDVRVYNRELSAEEAAVIPLRSTVSEIAVMPPEQRSYPQRLKLRMCLVQRFASRGLMSARDDLSRLRGERKSFHDTIPTVMVMQERDSPRETFVLKRGAYDAPGERVSAGVPSFLPRLQFEWPRNRLGLARWLVDRGNPLTARVTVNRLWQMLFGTGLVKTVEDFGSQGEMPSNQELLDWLAVEFMDSGWDVKHTLKRVVMSATYRQSSKLTPELLQRDPENRLLARGARHRLSPEMIRDQALAVSGLLVEKQGGPSVKPYQPAGLWQELSSGRGYVQDKGESLYRRTLYSYWKRTVAPPSMMTFDSPNRETCVVRETRTNTPMQALDLMNDVTFVEASRKLAERMIGAGPDASQRIGFAYRTVLGRSPKPQELVVLEQTLAKFETAYKNDRKAAAGLLGTGESPRATNIAPHELAAYTGIASIVLNLDEAVTKE